MKFCLLALWRSLGSGAEASEGAGFGALPNMVGSACTLCKAKQTTARAAGDICCVACGGIDGRGRPRRESAGPVPVVD